MVRLESHGRHHDLLGVILVELVGEHHECRTYALAAEGENILYGLIERIGFTLVGQLFDERIDAFENVVGSLHIKGL